MYFIKVRRLNTIKVVFVGAHFVEVGQKYFPIVYGMSPSNPFFLSFSLSLPLPLPPPPLTQAVPLTMETEVNAHIAFWVASVFMWVMFVWSKFSDPGYVKTNREAYEEALKLVRTLMNVYHKRRNLL